MEFAGLRRPRRGFSGSARLEAAAPSDLGL